MLSTFVFLALYASTRSIISATGLAITLGVARIAYHRFYGQAIDAMQWLSLGLVVVFGGATLLTKNPVFIMVKPSLIYLAIGVVTLRPGWMVRYVPPIAQLHAADVTEMFGYIWAGLFFATAAINLLVVAYTNLMVWAWYIGVFPTASKIVLVLVQYAVTRATVRRRVRLLAIA